MSVSPPRAELPTHDVENQPVPRVPRLWADDRPLREAVAAQGGDAQAVQDYAAALSGAEMAEAGRDANRNAPELRLFDRGGRRLDEVAFHPAYHRLMTAGTTHGYAARAWEEAPGGHVAHAAMVYLHSQVEPGTCCPMTMTYAAVPALAADADLAAAWTPKLTARGYDPRPVPLAEKAAATLGMAMTEKQGGSDVRANTTRAEPEGAAYRLTGHKWFCSAPMSDGFLTLAQAPGGLTCFLVPRWLEGARNAIQLMRLKDKLGNKANASAEIEYRGALAHRLGDEGQGVRTILRMVHHTRLDTAMAPAGLMRAALAEAAHWARHRTAFQRKLIDQPLMRAVLADLALETEGALALGLRVARAFDEADEPFARIAVALAKYLSNKRAPGTIYEAMEALGGIGYVEDTPLPLLYREAPLNSIWEGSGNVICLDILRTLARDPAAGAALQAELIRAKGADPALDAALAAHAARWPGLPEEAEARLYAERTATLLTAAILTEAAPAVAGAYIATRLGDRGLTAGAFAAFDAAPVLDRVLP
ncbi:acyl-CoA dehydrogenase family protein [Psychromarinibacter sp. C21-152]|uniref:Acyl-CoA dehydrogenase family protein n=1 Tax=Psychromarinibacter sediminicola TaxID=3033385 RepID=A0AAE3NR53_9RHOB|nr:acyl-CoA dehydrogenase family protein [Psychromarinibacter sediminicola]MDF0600921.1 acyl-CoA dehydrogenase family protein [Psychromarinibacter sediminicola]